MNPGEIARLSLRPTKIIWQTKIVGHWELETELNAYSSEGWVIDKIFQHPVTDMGQRYLIIARLDDG